MSARQEKLLLIEDDATLRLALTHALRAAGYAVETAADGPRGLEAAAADAPDLVLLDVMLPKMNGFEVCERLRQIDDDLPLLLITARGAEEDKVRGLRLGADDYLVKPFGLPELLARIDAALRRRRLASSRQRPFSVGAALIDLDEHRILRDGVPVEATALEIKLLRFFVRNEGRLLSRQRILDAVWGADYFGTDRTVDNFVTRLRAKIEPDPQRPAHLLTVRGVGYRFDRGDKPVTGRRESP